MRDRRPDVLTAIVASARRIVERRRGQVPESRLETLLSARPGTPGAFAAALERAPAPRIIAECKRRSPSRGVLRRHYDPVSLARAYEQGGAAAISVLTEPTFFDGEPEHLQIVRGTTSLPILRKDFVVDRYQVIEARAWGADAVLLIVAALSDRDLRHLVAEAQAIGIDTLVEAHSADEVARAADAGARIIGINNRNLRTLAVTVESSADLIGCVPDDVVAVAESGLQTRSDLTRLEASGFDAFLIGERLVTADDPAAALAALTGHMERASWPSA